VVANVPSGVKAGQVAEVQRNDRRTYWAPREYWAAHDPDRLAVVDGAASLRYGEWNAQADRLADAMDKLGLAVPAACVKTHQRLEWFVIRLALEKLGWDHIALNWQLQPTETAAVVADSGAGLIFSDDHSAELVPALRGLDARIISIEADVPGAIPFAAMLANPSPPPRFVGAPSAFVRYSSGTTGTPKGVRRARASDEVAQWERRRAAGLDPDLNLDGSGRPVPDRQAAPRTLLTTNLYSGIGLKGARMCYLRGGTTYLLDQYDPLRALEIIDQARITRWSTVPTTLYRIRALPQDILDSFDVRSMRVLGVGGAPVPQALKEWVLSYFGPCLYEAYGASELGLVTLMPPNLHVRKPGSCGPLRPNVSVRVIGPDGTAMPPGMEGELEIRTPQTISGYFNEADLDDGTVTPDGYFRIGDYGKLDEDGFLSITGRVKDMIIRGAYNVFPVEIENVIVEFPGIVEAAVIGIPDEEYGEDIMAFCQVLPGEEINREELAAFLAARLASFKRPRIFEFVEELPRNQVGKVVKPELRRPFWAGTGFKV
jgi:long-chain acyl-CoA synthetase